MKQRYVPGAMPSKGWLPGVAKALQREREADEAVPFEGILDKIKELIVEEKRLTGEMDGLQLYDRQLGPIYFPGWYELCHERQAVRVRTMRFQRKYAKIRIKRLREEKNASIR